jgi:hypothetical protein
VLLGVAADSGLKGGCLLGEMPHVFSQFPFPKASLAVLQTFSALASIPLNFSELQAQARQVEKGLEEFLHRLENSVGSPAAPAAGAAETAEADSPPPPPRLSGRDQQRVDELFAAARQDRSRAYELKQELDRLHIFHEYEDRFLDLFHKPG